MSNPAPHPATPIHPVAVKVTAKATRTAGAGYPCPRCPGTATYRYDMAPGLRFFRCSGCGVECPEASLTAHTPR